MASIYNTILGEASRQLTVIGELVDGNQLDITSDFYGTSYTSDDLLVANFGAEPGRVFAGEDGVTTVTATCSSGWWPATLPGRKRCRRSTRSRWSPIR